MSRAVEFRSVAGGRHNIGIIGARNKLVAITGKKEKVYDVEIVGMHLRLKSSHDSEFVKKVIQHVNQKVKEALPLTKNDSIQTAALLACLNMAEEQFLLKKQILSELEKVEEKAASALSRFENTYETQMGLDN
jgi:cell division protein ZapA (FtsZ GTPase activity inhibitor)